MVKQVYHIRGKHVNFFLTAQNRLQGTSNRARLCYIRKENKSTGTRQIFRAIHIRNAIPIPDHRPQENTNTKTINKWVWCVVRRCVASARWLVVSLRSVSCVGAFGASVWWRSCCPKEKTPRGYPRGSGYRFCWQLYQL